MFKPTKRFWIVLFTLLPVVYIIFVGFPIKKNRPITGESRRCFIVGETREFIECYKTGRQLKGGELIKNIADNLFSFYPPLPFLFFSSLIIHVVYTISFSFQDESVDKKKLYETMDKKKRK